MFWRKKPQPVKSVFTTDAPPRDNKPPRPVEFAQPGNAVAMDAKMQELPGAQVSWYGSQLFIGYHTCALISKHWLVDKACSMPARDAIRQGYRVDAELDYPNIDAIMREFVVTGRIFGGAAALFVVESTDPDYYEKPFNPDGVMPGQYKGIKIIEPTWMTPDLVPSNTQDPASLDFYVPSFWLIANRRYHKSHFRFYVPFPVANIMKHTYRFFGVSVPERIYERVYAAERTANEAPALLVTKRLLTMAIPDLGTADKATIMKNMEYFAEIRDNYGVNISDEGTTFNQFDTSLTDLEPVINQQYALVASAASVPTAKLLEDSPSGSLNASGEYESESYRQHLESIQTNDLEPLLSRHLQLTIRNQGLPEMKTPIVWEALDSPTAAEYADINLKKSQAAKNYSDIGAVDGMDVREQLAKDKESDFYGLKVISYEDEEEDGAVGSVPEGNTGGETSGGPGVGTEQV